jgi:hypothetical protein
MLVLGLTLGALVLPWCTSCRAARQRRQPPVAASRVCPLTLLFIPIVIGMRIFTVDPTDAVNADSISGTGGIQHQLLPGSAAFYFGSGTPSCS